MEVRLEDDRMSGSWKAEVDSWNIQQTRDAEIMILDEQLQIYNLGAWPGNRV